MSTSSNAGRRPRLLHIDSAYTLEDARRRGHLSFFRARHASGLFARVWSVHPLADAGGSPRRGIDLSFIGHGHAVIEGKSDLCRLPRMLRPLNLLISQWALYRLLVRLVRREKVDVIAAVDPFVSGLLGLAIARKTARPLVVRVSGNADDIYEASGALAHPRIIPSYRLQRAIARFVIRRADLVTAINRNNLQYGRNNGARRTAILPISANVAACHRAEPADRDKAAGLRDKWAIPQDSPLLLYVGRLITLKHPDDAVRAMATVIGRSRDVRGVIAGEGEMRPQLETLAAELGVKDEIRFVGVIDQAELARLLPDCILLSPSAGQLAVLESALAGTPIVAYDRDFQPEFIEDGIDGFIVPFRNWRSLAERVEQILADPALRAAFSERIRAKALDHVNPDRVRTAEWSAFAQSIEMPTPPASAV